MQLFLLLNFNSNWQTVSADWQTTSAWLACARRTNSWYDHLKKLLELKLKPSRVCVCWLVRARGELTRDTIAWKILHELNFKPSRVCVWCLLRGELTRDAIARKILLELKLKPQAGSVCWLVRGEPTRVILQSPEKNYSNPSLNQAGSVSNSWYDHLKKLLEPRVQLRRRH